ncbi:expressed unknown protein [Seminavis robusta]|uniref:C3H1-type domain-containing protein n=1 Tax=Seminavis robusta TaxID=568900 RepID=A0A9N8DIK1_9STRA|nr:expressed unknown protein [Seminavis robusta]|eukprot:Sro104_g053040.1 n/a (362) ;mRNA; r:114319-115404
MSATTIETAKLPNDTGNGGRIWRIFPRTSPRTFSLGDVVFFRPKSAKEDGKRGTVVEPMPDAKDHVWVEFWESGDTNNGNRRKKYVSCKRLVPVFTQSHGDQSIILTPDTIPYRHLAASQICETDDVLEIGCSTGEASVILCRYGRSWVGFDSSNDMIETSSAALQKMDLKILRHACKMDALSDPKRAMDVARKFNPKGPAAVFLDIGGNREEKGVLEMMSWVLESFPQVKVLVVKSREVVKDISSTISNKDNSSSDVIEDYGVVRNGSTWFHAKMESVNTTKLPRHPLQAPLVMSPLDATKPVCRYHNYDPKGCKKAANCPLDHEHCHLCLEKGHRAVNCSSTSSNKTGQKRKALYDEVT